MAKPKIAVLGGGNGGFTFAADLALAGNDVNLIELPRFESSIAAVKEMGGIETAGACRNGFAKPSMVTTDVEKGLSGVKIILFTMPSYGHIEWAKACVPYLEKGQILVLNPEYTLGSIEVAQALSEECVDLDDLTIGATNCLIYATRRYLPNRVFCMAVKHKMPFATFPAAKNDETIQLLNQILPQDDKKRGLLEPAENVLKTSMGNINPPTHIPLMILKAIDVELGEEPYAKSYESEAVNLMRHAMSKECMALMLAYELKPESYYYIHDNLMYPPWIVSARQENVSNPPSWVKTENLPGLYKSDSGLNLLKLRYMTEDVPYALVGLSGLGDIAGVPTPVIDSAITLGSTIAGEDFWKSGRTMEKLGLAGLDKKEIIRYVNEGKL